MSSTDQRRADARRVFGERLRKARKAAGLTQCQLGELLGMQQPEISGIERGKRTLPTDAIPLAASACRVRVAFFFPPVAEPPVAPPDAA